MLKKTLTNYFFLGLLSSVRSEGSYPASALDYRTSFVGSFKDKCSEVLDESACIYWDSLRDDISHFQSIKTPESQQEGGLSSENSTVPGKQFQEDNSDEKFLVDVLSHDPRNSIDKRFAVFRRRNPKMQGYKRGPGFRSWGGKRDSQNGEDPLVKKPKFTSWGGKRNNFWDESKESEKRSKFVSWGGKRTIPLEEVVKKEAEIPSFYEQDKRSPFWKEALYLDEPSDKHFPKRPQFQSWGGKRSLYPLHRFLAFFYARPPSILNGEKRKFSSWGGKRNYENQYGNFLGGMKNELKEHNFQS